MQKWFNNLKTNNSTKDDSVIVRKVWSTYLMVVLVFTYWDEGRTVHAWHIWLIAGMFLVINVVNTFMRIKIKDMRRKEFHYLQYLDLAGSLIFLVLTGWKISIMFLFYLSIVMAVLTYGVRRGYIYASATTVSYIVVHILNHGFPTERTIIGFLVFTALSFMLTAFNGSVLSGQIKAVEKANEELETANQELAQRNSELFVLQQISNHVISILNIDDLLKMIPDILVGISGAEYAAIYLSEDGTFTGLKNKATNCQDKDLVEELFQGVCGYRIRNTFLTAQSIIENHINCGEFGSLVSIPIKHKDQLLGVLVLTHSRTNAFSEVNMQLLIPVANQLSIAIANARLYDQVRQMANIDGLTGVYNRKYFQDYLDRLFVNSTPPALTLIMIDVDHFKIINDTLGHLMGDQVLKRMTDIIKRTVDKRGILARYGGEEFVVLLPEVDVDEGYEIAEEIRIRVSQEKIFYLNQCCNITISLGVAGNNRTCIGTMDDLLNAADAALYQAKDQGRDCTVRADEVLVQKSC